MCEHPALKRAAVVPRNGPGGYPDACEVAPSVPVARTSRHR
jgi:hypothetical protein